jgi:hypothetical protein
VEPPGGKGTTSVVVEDWPNAGAAAKAADAASIVRLVTFCIAFLPDVTALLSFVGSFTIGQSLTQAFYIPALVMVMQTASFCIWYRRNEDTLLLAGCPLLSRSGCFISYI